MAREVGDLWPQASGTSSLGAEMTNGGFTGAVRPFGAVHQNSGVWHNPATGSSGVLRYQISKESSLTTGQEVFGFSTDGGKTFVFELGDNTVGQGGLGADLIAPFGPLRMIGSGGIALVSLTGGIIGITNGSIGLISNGGGVTGDGDISLQTNQNVKLSPFNGSGQLDFRFGPHQAWYAKLSHSNVGGPFNDGYWPIAHSGQVAAMIAIASGSMGNVNLQNAYYGGDEILLKQAGVRSDGILLKQRATTRFMLPGDLIGQDPGYGIAVSGVTPTPQNPHSYPIAFLGMNALAFQGSGVFGSNGHLWMGIDQSNNAATLASSGSMAMNVTGGFTGTYGGFIEVVTGGSYKLFVQDSLIQIQATTASMQLSAGTSMTIGSNQTVDISSSEKGMTLTASDGDSSSTANIALSADTDVHLSAFAGSGHLLYRFGPYQSWFLKTSFKTTGGPDGDGYWPIAHSGNVSQLVNQAIIGLTRDIGSGLQYQYNFGDEITLANRPALTPRGVTLKYQVGAKLSLPDDPISVEHGYGIAVSGASSTPTNISSYGIAMLAVNALDVRGSGSSMPNFWAGVDPIRQHARISTSGVLRIDAGSGIIVTSPTIFAGSGTRPPLSVSGVFTPSTRVDRAGDVFMMNHHVRDVGIISDQITANAKAMGVGELVLQTGSGTINVSIGSGVAQFLTLAVMKITAVEQNVPFSNLNYLVSDKNFACGTEAAGTSGQIAIFSPGLYRADFKVQATKTVGTTPQVCRYRALLNGVALLGATCNSFHYDAVAAASNSATLSVLFNADAGDKFSVGILSSLDGADNCQLDTRAGLLIVQRIGSKRSTF